MRLRQAVAGLTTVLALCLPVPAEAECRQALILALDVSGSVDAREYELQVRGVAAALDDPDVRRALLAVPDAPVALAVFEWAASRHQRSLVDWTLLSGHGVIDAVASTLRATQRSPAPEATGIGAALLAAERLFEGGPVCWRRTVDVSADGRNNDRPEPRTVYAGGALPGVTVNALVIGGDLQRSDDYRSIEVPELMAYFRAEVIRGPDAFVEVALGYDDYAAAMTRKLLREVASVAVGAAPEPPTGPRIAAAGDQ